MPWIKKGADYFWPKVQHADEAAVRGAISQYESGLLDPNSPQYSALKELLGIPFDSPSEELLARSSQRTRDNVNQALKSAQSPSKPTSQDAFTNQSDKLAAALKDLRQSIVDREADKAKQQYFEGEVRSSIYPGSIIIGEFFGAPQFAKTFSIAGTESLKVWQLVQGFNSIPPTVGSLALTGGFISAGLSVGQALAAIPSSEEATQAALKNIQLALSTLQQEMHEGFDRIQRNQRLMMEELNEIFSRIVQGHMEQLVRLEQMHESLNGLRSYIEAQDRQTQIVVLNQALDKLKLIAPLGGHALGSIDGLNYLTQFVDYAVDVSTLPAFTDRQVTSWIDTAINDALQSAPRPDLAIGLLNVIRTHFGLNPIAEDMPNPIEWARGTHVFLESVSPSRKQLPVETHSMVKRLYTAGRSLNDALTKSIDLALGARVSSEYSNSFAEVRSVLSNYYQNAP